MYRILLKSKKKTIIINAELLGITGDNIPADEDTTFEVFSSLRHDRQSLSNRGFHDIVMEQHIAGDRWETIWESNWCGRRKE